MTHGWAMILPTISIWTLFRERRQRAAESILLPNITTPSDCNRFWKLIFQRSYGRASDTQVSELQQIFIVNGGYKTKYCDMPSPENPNRTCNQMDFAKKKPKEKNAEKRTLLAKSEKLYHSAMTSPEFTNDEFEQQLSSASLYRLCGMEPPRKGRSGQADDRRTCKQGKDITRYEYSDWLKNLHVAKSEFSVSLRLKYLTFSDILVIY